jgi:hypothetical protein
MRGEVMARLEGNAEVNNEKFNVLLGRLVSRMVIHQARREANQQGCIARTPGRLNAVQLSEVK